ncbi:MAG: DDE-type integrase/transposase/recombinase, partial [Flavobacteriales bacterium]|nr:DDE-type integrase/transposase/recombinase [Flavobacteriales bacterium]
RTTYFRTPSKQKYPIAEQGNSYTFEANYAASDNAERWHKRFMHVGQDGVKRCAKYIPGLANYKHDPIKCSSCQIGGARSKAFGRKHEKHKYTYLGERISSDLCGPFPESIDGYTYAVLFHDRWSKYYTVYLIKDKTKESTLQAFKDFLHDHKDILPNGVKEFHSDNGSEMVNQDFEAFCEEIACRRTYTVPYAPQLNPYAERTWGSLLRKVRTVLSDTKVPEVFWSYAIRQAAVVGNAIPRSDSAVSPYELVWSKPFDYNTLHVWGSKMYYMLPEKERTSKFSPRALPGVYLGEDPKRLGHVVWIPELRRITTGYHVVFSEDENYDFANSHRQTVPRRVRFQFGTGHYREERDLPQGRDPNCEACQGRHRAHTCGRRSKAATPGERRTEDHTQPQPVADPDS